jgi:ferredoxin, 2Fe-2S
MDGYHVSVEPKPGVIEVRPDETVMDAAERLGYRWPTLCGGVGECRVCVMEVVSGAGGLSIPDAQEEAAIRSTFGSLQRRARPLRQACRAVVVGQGVTVFKRGVVPNDRLGEGE